MRWEEQPCLAQSTCFLTQSPGHQNSLWKVLGRIFDEISGQGGKGPRKGLQRRSHERRDAGGNSKPRVMNSTQGQGRFLGGKGNFQEAEDMY